MIVVADASPLIALCRIGRLDLLHDIFGQLIIPDAVWQEVSASHPGKAGAAEIMKAPWIKRRSAMDLPLVSLCGKASVLVSQRPLCWPARSKQISF